MHTQDHNPARPPASNADDTAVGGQNLSAFASDFVADGIHAAETSALDLDHGVHPPVEPIFGIDDNDRPCGCDDHAKCREHEAVDELSDAELELALEELESRGTLTATARDILIGIDVLDCESERAKFLLQALDAWDNAGTGNGHRNGRISAREHDVVYCKLAAALIDQILVDRRADPDLVGDLAASVGGAS